jgi:uncharacterized protein (TIGR00159 family)
MVFTFKIGLELIEIGWIDVIDIFLVAFLFYQLYQIVKGSVALRIILGGTALFAIWLVVNALEMELLSTILGQFIGVGVLGALVLFQPEIRKFLLLIGKAEYFRNNIFVQLLGRKSKELNFDVDIFIDACMEMAASNTGALLVFTKSSELKIYIETGDWINAEPSRRLIIAIFNKYAPLHDGAMIIGKDGKILAAKCLLPLSENLNLPPEMGLRHRSAVGLTEVTDAIVLVVSEERGSISLVKSGIVIQGLSMRELKKKIIFYLTNHDSDEENNEIKKETPKMIDIEESDNSFVSEI